MAKPMTSTKCFKYICDDCARAYRRVFVVKVRNAAEVAQICPRCVRAMAKALGGKGKK